VEDGYAALAWVGANIGSLGGSPGHIGIGGSSAGGGLAACIAVMARDRGGPALAHQLLIYPVLDDAMSTPSMREFVETAPWDATASRLMWRYYLGPGAGPATAYAAAARAVDLAGLPPAYLSAAERDPLRDEDLDYGRRLIEAGVSTELHHYPGTFHGFDLVGATTVIGRAALAEQTAVLRRYLRPAAP
jgi:acetyl esterase/lipase